MDNNYWDWLAFISYKHDDIEWARWLQEKLERYKLPSYLNDDYPCIRKNLRPIFRDETDLRLGYLTDNIIYALKKSKYLIVVCSPTTFFHRHKSKDFCLIIIRPIYREGDSFDDRRQSVNNYDKHIGQSIRPVIDD